MEGCLFCKIVRKEIPAKISAESSKAIAFHDINPQAPVHVLIIPKEHIESILEVERGHSEILADMISTAQKCAKDLGIDESGFRLVFNCGPNAGQAVDHLHLHLLGKRKLSWPPG
jgi:histidine triad (HIT) family protein